MPEQVWVPGGEFIMGSDVHYPDEGPARRVAVEGFHIDSTPVTNGEFAEFVGVVVVFVVEGRIDCGRIGAWQTAIGHIGTGLATLNTTMTTFLDKLAESQKAKEEEGKKDTLTAGQLVAKLSESGLPAPSQKRLAESYTEGSDLDKMIEDEKAYVTSITESAKPGKVTRGADDKGQKPGTVETDDKTAEDKELTESLAAFGNLFG